MVVDKNGRFSVPVPVLVAVRPDEMARCVACVIQQRPDGPAAGIAFAAAELRTVEAGPFSGAGQLIALTGQNFTPGGITVYACADAVLTTTCGAGRSLDADADGVLSGSIFLDHSLCTTCYVRVISYPAAAQVVFTRTPSNPDTVTVDGGTLTGTVAAGGTVTTGSVPTSTVLVAVTLTSTSGGNVSIGTTAAPAPSGFSLLGSIVAITPPGRRTSRSS